MRLRRALGSLLAAAALLVLAPSVAAAAGGARAPGGEAPAPALSAREAILLAPQTGQLLYGVAPDREVAIASTTKLMTALVTLERVPLSRVFTQPNYYSPPEDSQIGLVPGERMSVHDLLLAMLLPSADDAAEDLAFNVGHGSVPRFIELMNRRARELGLTHTHYSTPIGLDTPGNYSSAADLAKLAAYDLTHEPFFARAVAQRSAVLRSGAHVRVVQNRNDLVGRVPWIDGVKTGHTLQAGYVLVGSGARNGLRLISVVLGTDSEASRDANTLALLRYGFDNFRLLTAVRRGQALGRAAERDRSGRYVELLAERSFVRVMGRGEHLSVRLQAPRQLAGPLRRHALVGHAVVLANGRPVARIPVLVAQAVPAVSSLTKAARFVTEPVTLVSLLVLLGAVAALLLRRRMRARQEEKAEPA